MSRSPDTGDLPEGVTLDGVDTVLFDVDGTLIDSTYHHTVAWAQAFGRFDLNPPLWRVHRSIGMGGDKLVAQVLGQDVEDRHGDDLRQIWEEQYREILPRVRAFERAGDAVRAVREKGFKVALASSGKAEFTRQAMEKMGLSDEDVDAVTTSDDADHSKPAPDILTAALEAAGGRHAVLMGDATWDVESATNAGMACAGVRTGGFSGHELREAGAVLVVDAVTDLADGQWLADLLGRSTTRDVPSES